MEGDSTIEHDEKLLTRYDAAEYLRVSLRTLDGWLKLPARRKGKRQGATRPRIPHARLDPTGTSKRPRIRFRKRDLDAFVERFMTARNFAAH